MHILSPILSSHKYLLCSTTQTLKCLVMISYIHTQTHIHASTEMHQLHHYIINLSGVKTFYYIHYHHLLVVIIVTCLLFKLLSLLEQHHRRYRHLSVNTQMNLSALMWVSKGASSIAIFSYHIQEGSAVYTIFCSL